LAAAEARHHYAENVDRLIRLREPATMVALLGLALHLVLTVAYLMAAPIADDVLLADLAVSLGNPLLVGLPAVLAATCWLGEVTPRARGLTVFGVLLTATVLAATAGVLIASMVLAPAGATAGLLGVLLRGIPGLTVAALGLLVLLGLLRQPSVAVAAETDQVAELPRVSAVLPADPQLQPGWSPDAAVGAVWRRAGDAAEGAPATSWEAAPDTSGWGPIPTADGPPQASSEKP
jgi:uncharacterized membrane protein